MKAGEQPSLFLEFFGGTPIFRMIDFLLEHRLQDFTKTEIAKGAGISWATLFNYWDDLEARKLLKLTRVVGRAKLYQLNEGEPLVKELVRMEMLLIKRAAEEEGEKLVMKVKARK